MSGFWLDTWANAEESILRWIGGCGTDGVEDEVDVSREACGGYEITELVSSIGIETVMTDSVLDVTRLEANEANLDFLGVLLCTDETSGVVMSGRVCWRIVLA